MGAEPGRPNELSPITRIDTARMRPVQSAAGRSFIEPGSPWQNPFVESFGCSVRDEVLSVEAFDSFSDGFKPAFRALLILLGYALIALVRQMSVSVGCS